MKTFRVALAVAFLSVEAIAAERPARIDFVRPLGMGGAFTAVADDQNIFTYNPAGLVQRTGPSLTLLEIAVGGSEDTQDVYDYIEDNEDELTDFEDLPFDRKVALINEIKKDIAAKHPHLYLASDLATYVSGPRFLGMPIHGGVGVLGAVDGTVNLNADVVPYIRIDVNADAVVPLTIAKRWEAPGVPGKIGLGVTGKYIHRRQVRYERISVFELEDIGAPPQSVGRGFGADIGLLYQPVDRVNVGVMIQDAFGTKLHFDKTDPKNGFPGVDERDSVIRPRTNIGLALFPKKLFWFIPTGQRLTLAADIRDVFAKDEHVLFERGFKKIAGEHLYTHLYVGAEFRWWFLRFRGGAYQGYPSAGLGIDIPVMKIDYAFYSRELGPRAGDLQEKNHAVSVAFRFGSGKTERREKIKPNAPPDPAPGATASLESPVKPTGTSLEKKIDSTHP